MVNGHFVFYDDGTPATPQLPLPPHLTYAQAQSVGWVFEWFDGRTKSSKNYPNGRCRWLSEPARPVHRDVAIAEVTRRKKEHQEQWEEDGNKGVYDPPTFRIRNVYTADVVMGAIL